MVQQRQGCGTSKLELGRSTAEPVQATPRFERPPPVRAFQRLHRHSLWERAMTVWMVRRRGRDRSARRPFRVGGYKPLSSWHSLGSGLGGCPAIGKYLVTIVHWDSTGWWRLATRRTVTGTCLVTMAGSGTLPPLAADRAPFSATVPAAKRSQSGDPATVPAFHGRRRGSLPPLRPTLPLQPVAAYTGFKRLGGSQPHTWP